MLMSKSVNEEWNPENLKLHKENNEKGLFDKTLPGNLFMNVNVAIYTTNLCILDKRGGAIAELCFSFVYGRSSLLHQNMSSNQGGALIKQHANLSTTWTPRDFEKGYRAYIKKTRHSLIFTSRKNFGTNLS